MVDNLAVIRLVNFGALTNGALEHEICDCDSERVNFVLMHILKWVGWVGKISLNMLQIVCGSECIILCERMKVQILMLGCC